MSMISAQIDELRSMAESVGLAMPQAATLMMEAADTIWQLRDDLQRANVENAKLRKLVWDMNKWLWNGADCTECPFTAECDLNAAFESDLHAHICIGWSEIHDRMHKLGIEVDG
jgi:hypothetical protein